MTDATSIRLEPAKRLAPQQELVLIRQAYARAPESPMLRLQLANLLNTLDLFAETIGLLSTRKDLVPAEQALLIDALISTETRDCDAEALALCQRALAETTDDRERAAILADGAKAAKRLGCPETRAMLVEALRLDPHNRNACKRLAALLFERSDPGAVRAFTQELIERGVRHSRLFAAQALADAQLGRHAEVRAAIGFDRLGIRTMLAPPPGYASLAAFNAALARDLLADPAIRYDRYGAASERTWRIDALGEKPGAPVALLLAAIRAQIAAHADRLRRIDDPWVSACPSAATLHAWCVIAESTSFENWHVHPFGWLSGTYYVAVPDSIAARTDERGCIAFGLPEDLAGAENAAAIGQDLLRPVPGQLLLFPSHSYHRTFPHASRDRRICIAFDLRPD